MKRTLAIAKRVLTELRRDKRTLAFVLVMPVVILWLLNVMFSANSSTNVTVATVNVNPAVTKQIDAVKHVKVEKFTQEKTADYRLKHQQVDAVIKQTGNQYRVRYANIDASKTKKKTKKPMKTGIIFEKKLVSLSPYWYEFLIWGCCAATCWLFGKV